MFGFEILLSKLLLFILVHVMFNDIQSYNDLVHNKCILKVTVSLGIQRKGLEGLVTGVGQGVTGLFIKPIVGVADFSTSILKVC